ncbi:hydroxymethylglutaryl-CoA reductase, degradative [Candidatus Micrarchaeota archaeon]|nr:hydroxymethylglutaryl-CoA reductase, degradative [Candidatus Micrarchaeota archaeon]
MASSAISGFHKLSQEERLKAVKEFAGLSVEEAGLLKQACSLEAGLADKMIENVVGTLPLPLGIATNFQVNGKDHLVPMVVEEPSVVAAASHAAKLARAGGGFQASITAPVMIGQIQLLNVKDFEKAKKKIAEKEAELLAFANEQDPMLVKFKGGAKKIEARQIVSIRGKMLIVHLLVDVRDAMGANAVNTMCEALSPKLEEITGGEARLRILSNLAIHRVARATAIWKKEEIGAETVEGVLDAYAFAEADAFRCTTHNKGVMNGIDAVVLATGNDWRAVEAGAHAYASMKGKYSSLTKYAKDNNSNLVGSIELPLAVGLVGGATKTHPIARIAVKILGVKTASELAQVVASVGLAQNFSALRALATEGIQRGHMGLHARNVAIAAGATGSVVDEVAKKMVESRKVRADEAKKILEELAKTKK